MAQIEQRQIVLPQQYEKNSKNKGSTVHEIFYEYPYVSDTVDLSDFKQKHPAADLPDQLTIQSPNLNKSASTIFLMGYLKSTPLHSADVFVLLLVENFNTDKVTFYVDKNIDGNYLNDGPPQRLKAQKEPYPIEIFPSKQTFRTFWIQVPERQVLIDGIVRDLEKNIKTKITNRFAIEFHAGVGSGDIRYQFDDLNRGFPTWYSISQSEKYLGVGLSYDLPMFRVGLSATYQHLFHYTSYINIRYDEREVIIDPSTNRRTIRENVLVERNIDEHAKNRFQYSAFLMGRIPLKRYAEFQPFVSIGQIQTLPNEYLSDVRNDINIGYKLPTNTFWETGLRFEFTTGQRKAFFIGISRYQLNWQPTNFLAEGQENFQSKAATWKALFGYRLGRK